MNGSAVLQDLPVEDFTAHHEERREHDRQRDRKPAVDKHVARAQGYHQHAHKSRGSRKKDGGKAENHEGAQSPPRAVLPLGESALHQKSDEQCRQYLGKKRSRFNRKDHGAKARRQLRPLFKCPRPRRLGRLPGSDAAGVLISESGLSTAQVLAEFFIHKSDKHQVDAREEAKYGDPDPNVHEWARGTPTYDDDQTPCFCGETYKCSEMPEHGVRLPPEAWFTFWLRKPALEYEDDEQHRYDLSEQSSSIVVDVHRPHPTCV